MPNMKMKIVAILVLLFVAFYYTDKLFSLKVFDLQSGGSGQITSIK